MTALACALRCKVPAPVSGSPSRKFGKLWLAAEILLFVLVGAAVDIRYTLGAFGPALAMILAALFFRALGVLLCPIAAPLTARERLFCVIAYLPKATVQAAIGSVPLAMGLSCRGSKWKSHSDRQQVEPAQPADSALSETCPAPISGGRTAAGRAGRVVPGGSKWKRHSRRPAASGSRHSRPAASGSRTVADDFPVIFRNVILQIDHNQRAVFHAVIPISAPHDMQQIMCIIYCNAGGRVCQ